MAPPWSLLLLVASAAAVHCPDGTTCGENTLCCELPDGHGYGCCPENEVMSRSLPMITGVSCSHHKGCPEEYSCVDTPQGGSACCPSAQGTSCRDGHHCCPSGSHCSEDGHHCVPASNLSAIICPDGSSECPSDTTCCQMADQTWGCCPIPQAVCCNDHLHCCPHASVCDVEHSRCSSENGDVPLLKKVPARARLVSADIVREVNCLDGSSCPDGTTCCQTTDQHYGCCPFMSAVCCSDFVHCCPSGTSCDVAQKKCVSANFEIPMYNKIPAVREKATVQCDDQVSCPGTATCCRLPSGEWGCCPYEKAVCCDDHQHCCPSGYTCIGGQCQTGTLSVPWSEKTPAIKQKGGDVPCDKQTSCPDETTCCRLASGEWGCCPYKQAVCCSDHLHCCPSGYTCDISSGSCNKPSGALEKATPIQPLDYVWCDGTHACYDGQTCCVGVGGVWTCCPYTQGVCCPDRVHCCPYGHVCLNHGAQCSRSGSLRWDMVWEKRKPRL